MGNDGAVPCSLRHLHRIQRLRERSDLVYLDQNRICRAKCNAAGKPSYIRHKQIIPDQLYSVPERFRHLFPAFEIVLAQPVFDGYDRVFFNQFLIVGNHFCGIPKYCLSALTGFPGKVVDVPALLVELACRRIDRDHHVVSRRIAGFLDRIDNELQCFIGIL